MVVYDEIQNAGNQECLTQLHVFSKFQDLAHGGNFRQDGRLLVAGTEEGTVKVSCLNFSAHRC